MGLGFGLGRLGGILGPVLGGIMLAMKLSLFQCFLMFAIPSLINFVAILLVPDKYSYQNAGKLEQQAAPGQLKTATAAGD